MRVVVHRGGLEIVLSFSFFWSRLFLFSYDVAERPAFFHVPAPLPLLFADVKEVLPLPLAPVPYSTRF